MTKNLPLPGSGDVPITLDGEDLFLKPTLEACLRISRLHGNPHDTATKIMAMDFDTVVAVVGIGLRRTTNKDLQEKVYKTGLVNLRASLISFIHIVNNGGRPIEDEGSEDEKKTEENPQEPSL
jgi:hypothetical protein